MAVFGLRHQGAGTGQTLQGSIEDARIYDRALTAEEIRKLEPNKESGIKPFAWWNFEKGKEADLTGRFPFNELSGGVKIEGGRLVLEAGGAALTAAGRKTTGETGVVLGTPAMPANPPADWLTYHLLHPGPGGAKSGSEQSFCRTCELEGLTFPPRPDTPGSGYGSEAQSSVSWSSVSSASGKPTAGRA